jgi:hypothetical protein
VARACSQQRAHRVERVLQFAADAVSRVVLGTRAVDRECHLVEPRFGGDRFGMQSGSPKL